MGRLTLDSFFSQKLNRRINSSISNCLMFFSYFFNVGIMAEEEMAECWCNEEFVAVKNLNI